MYRGYQCCCTSDPCAGFPSGACPCGCYDAPGTCNVDFTVSFGSGTLGYINYFRDAANEGSRHCNDYCGVAGTQGCGHLNYLVWDVFSQLIPSLSVSFSTSFRVGDIPPRCGVQEQNIVLASQVQCDSRVTCDKCLHVNAYIDKWGDNIIQLVWRSYCASDGTYGSDDEHSGQVVFNFNWAYSYGAFINYFGYGPHAYIGMTCGLGAAEYIGGSLQTIQGLGGYFSCNLNAYGDNCTDYTNDPHLTTIYPCQCQNNVLTTFQSNDVIFSGGSGGDINFGPNASGSVTMTYTPDNPS